ncbi:MAG: maleylpyruvate isomerase N-terminal domain-containing protein [Actinomycetota bacterium]
MVRIDPKIAAAEDALWHELWSTVDGLTQERFVEPGYFAEHWSAKDALAHIGTWLAEAGAALEQIHGGTYVPLTAAEVDEMNERFLEAMRDAPPTVVKSQATAARSRMLHAWADARQDDEHVHGWIRKTGPDHYGEHLPRLQEWLAELDARHSVG